MTIHENDPKLTAYALGELSDDESRAVAAQIERSPELAAAVERIKETAAGLESALEGDGADLLTDARREAIKERAAGAAPMGGVSGVKRRRVRWRVFVPVAAAAVLVIGTGVVYWSLPSLSRARSVAVRRQSKVENIGGVGPSARLYAERGRRSSRRASGGERYSSGVNTEVEGAPRLASLGYVSPLDREFKGQVLVGRLGYAEGAGVADTDTWMIPPLSGMSREAYDHIVENPFHLARQQPLSTFSIDVDTAAYANVRRFLTQGRLPPAGAVRIEEMVNYFDYAYPPPAGPEPFSVNVEVADCPWAPEHLLARIGIKGKTFAPVERPSANLVFLIDVSGSMRVPNKLPLLKEAMRLLVDELYEDDSVAIVVYAGASGLVLPPTLCSQQGDVLRALDGLAAGGSTNGGAGIQLAYDTAMEGFIEGGVNRVILATDGDFNVGITDRGSLTHLIEEKAKSGVFLTVLGFGMGNYNDATLETLADKGNGNYAYIDTLNEAQKVLVDQIGGTLVTIAKDVKIQVEFNPAEVEAYRLIGYENRLLAAEDFNDDTKDAGEIGAGHTVTAFYELVPAGEPVSVPPVDALKYQSPSSLSAASGSGELMTVKLRYKEPAAERSQLIELGVLDEGLTLETASEDFVFAASVASFGMLLRAASAQQMAGTPEGAPVKYGDLTLAAVEEMAAASVGEDAWGYRSEFVGLVERARALVEQR